MKTRYKIVEGGKELRQGRAWVELQGRMGREEWERRFISGLIYT